MNSPNIQKLITSFLILAALTSSSIFWFSNQTPNTARLPSGSGPQKITLNGKSAFVEKIANLSNYDSPILARSDISSPYPTGNITDNFTDQLAEKLISANPNGPDMNKKNPLVLPTDFASITTSAGLIPANFSPQIENGKIRIAKNYTPEDILNYLTATQKTVQNVLAPVVQQLSARSMSMQSLSEITAIYDQTESAIYQTSVPAPLQNFNHSLLGLINIQRTFFDQTDPAKTLIALQNPALVIAPYKKALDNEAKKLQNNLPIILGEAPGKDKDKFASAINFFLGVQTVYAFDFLGGVSGIISALLDVLGMVLQQVISQLTNVEFWRKLATELLKDTLVKKLVSKVVTWVQGGGNSQYVSNWQKLLGDAAGRAAGAVVQEVVPQLCESFQPLAKLVLTPPAVGATAGPVGNPYACTLDTVLGNLEAYAAYAENFQNGGWEAYGALLKPQNNYVTAYMDISDQQLFASGKAEEAAQNETTAGSGYKSQKQCNDVQTYRRVNGDRELDSMYSTADLKTAFGDAYVDSDCSDAVSGTQTCASVDVCNLGKPEGQSVTTPGSTVDSTLNQNMGAGPIQRIVNAVDFTGLISALVSSALTKLIDEGQKGLVNLTADKLASDGNLADTCNGLTGAALQKCNDDNAAIGATTSSSAGSTKDGVLIKVKKIKDLGGKLLDEAQKIDSLITQSLSALDTASTTCWNTLFAASSTLDAANGLKFISQNTNQLENASGTYKQIINTLGGFQPPAPAPYATSTLTMLDNVIQLIENDRITDLSAEFNIPLVTSGDDQFKREDFYGKFSGSIDSPSSVFGRKYGTLNSISDQTSDAKQFEIALSLPRACGILEKAQRMSIQIQVGEDTGTCSIALVEKSCGGGP